MSARMGLHVALSLRLDAIEAYRLANAYRTEVLREAAAELVAFCPDHGDRDTSFMNCHCPAAEEIRKKLDAVIPAAPAADLTALRARVAAIHREVDGSPHGEGSCIEDGQDYPCATLRALDTAGGA